MESTKIVYYKKSNVMLGDKDYQIITPSEMFHSLYVCKRDEDAYIVFGNKQDLIEISEFLEYLSERKDIILYLPAIKEMTPYIQKRWKATKSYDLVLVSHALQLRFKDWKNLRNHIRKMKVVGKERFTIKDNEFAIDKFNYTSNRDVLKIHSNYHTLFMIGSEVVFKYMAEDFRQVGEDGRQTYDEHKGYHEHAHLDNYMHTKDRYNNRMTLSVDFYDEELWKSE